MAKKIIPLVTAAFALAAGSASAATLPGIGTFEGNAGIGSSNGDVGDNASGSEYIYVTTAGSDYLGAGIGIGSETNGTELTTDSFSAEAGEELSYEFNYITSDGTPSFIEYAYAQLNNLDTAMSTLIFTARTNPNGDPTVPGFGLPDLGTAVTLDPMSTVIQDGLTNWSELGNSSGACFQGLGNGCGSTGWINSSLTVADAGSYSLTFGVVNWGDEGFDSGLAISGITVGDTIIVNPSTPSEVPLPAGVVLLLSGLMGLGFVRRRSTV